MSSPYTIEPPYIKLCDSRGYTSDGFQLNCEVGETIVDLNCEELPTVDLYPKGLHFTDTEHAAAWADILNYTHYVVIEPLEGAIVRMRSDTAVARALQVLEPVRPLSELYATMTLKRQLKMLHHYLPVLKYLQPKPELCVAAVRQCGLILGDDCIPKELKTAKMCWAAVQQNALALRYVPKKHITADLCRMVVQEGGHALQYVPKEHITAELCLLAVQKCGHALQYVPEDLKTAEMCLLAVRDYSYLLMFVPKHLKTAEMCLLAVQQDGVALRYVPDKLITDKLCMKAVKWCRKAMMYVPKDLATAEFCLEVVQYYGRVLKYVPDELKTAELCRAAVQQDATALKYVPEELVELCQVACTK